MCEPISLTTAAVMAASLAATTAGTVMASEGASAQAQAQSDAQARAVEADAAVARKRLDIQRQAEKLQDSFAGAARQRVGQQVEDQGYTAQKATLDAETGRRAASMNREADAIASGDSLPTSADAPRVINDQVSGQIKAAIDRVKGENQGRAALSAFAGQGVDNQISNQRSGDEVNTIQGYRRAVNTQLVPAMYQTTDFMRGTNDARLQRDMAGAYNVGAGDRLLGSLITGAGAIGARYGGQSLKSDLDGDIFTPKEGGSLGRLWSRILGGGGSYGGQDPKTLFNDMSGENRYGG